MDIVFTPGLDPAHDVLHYGRQPLDGIFAPKSVAVIGATENPGSVGRTIALEPAHQPLWRDHLSRQSQATQHSGHQSLPHSRRFPEAGGPGRHRHPATSIPGIIEECGEHGVRAPSSSPPASRRLGPEGAELERQSSSSPPRQYAHHRTELPGRDESRQRLQRHLRHHHRPPRHVLASSARAARSVPPSWTGACRKMSASATSSPSARCWMWTGATSSTTSATTPYQEHRHLHGDRSATPALSSRPLAKSP